MPPLNPLEAVTPPIKNQTSTTQLCLIQVLAEFDVPLEITVVSAHRTPERMMEYAKTAAQRGLKVIIAGAGAVNLRD